MNETPVFARLPPPPGGWERLLSRRDAPAHTAGLSLPIAVTGALALALFVAWPRPHELDLPWSADRLVAQPSEGVTLRLPGDGDATALPSADPRVRIYWVE